MKTIVFECVEYFDKTNGNTYSTGLIYVDGTPAKALPVQYGDMSMIAHLPATKTGIVQNPEKAGSLERCAHEDGAGYVEMKREVTNMKKLEKEAENFAKMVKRAKMMAA